MIRSAFVTSFALLLALPFAHAQTAHTGQQVYNAEFATAWRAVIGPALQQKIETDLRASLSGLKQTSGKTELEVLQIKAIDVDVDEALGFPTMQPNRVVLRMPMRGGWTIGVKTRVRLRRKVGPIRVRSTFDLEFTIRDLSLAIDMHLDNSDPLRPQLQRVAPPNVDFRLELRASNLLLRLFRRPLERRLNDTAQQSMTTALLSAAPLLQNLQGLPGPIPGDGSAPLADSGTPSLLPEVVANVDRKLVNLHSPYGITVTTLHTSVVDTTWEEAYRNGGSGVGSPLSHFWNGGDACMWTGHFLAAQAFRYAHTGDPEALSMVRHTLEGVTNLLGANADTGLLCRNAAPLNSGPGQQILTDPGQNNRNMYKGEIWVTNQGHKGITRDQYSGAFFGLAVAYDLVNDQAVRDECARLITMMLDYIIARDWIVDEDRRPFDVVDRTTAPTIWAGIGYQELAYVLMGERVAPGRYAAELARISPLAEVAWLNSWGTTFGLDHFYKFNLQYINYYNYFRLQTDVLRWQQMYRATQISYRYIGHHRNPHFDLIQSSYDPSLQASRYPGVREVLRRFIRRKHRHLAPAVVDLSGVTWDTITQTQYVQNPQTGVTTLVTSTHQVPSEPLTPEIMRLSHNFLWQHHPFTPVTPGSGDGRWETLGVELTLPYWMGHYQGAF